METLPHIKIKKIRKIRGFSQHYMAKHLNISQMAYSKIERNKTQLNWQKLNRIAKILEINIWELINTNKEFNDNNQINHQENIKLTEKLIKQFENRIKELEKENIILKNTLKTQKVLLTK